MLVVSLRCFSTFPHLGVVVDVNLLSLLCLAVLPVGVIPRLFVNNMGGFCFVTAVVCVCAGWINAAHVNKFAGGNSGMGGGAGTKDLAALFAASRSVWMKSFSKFVFQHLPRCS